MYASKVDVHWASPIPEKDLGELELSVSMAGNLKHLFSRWILVKGLNRGEMWFQVVSLGRC